ncbi:MAG: alpha/beta hydrolase [Chloroflexi bacterium]|nr:MAG: alpha/beta hydrolase [Chloroflexota bacterium]
MPDFYSQPIVYRFQETTPARVHRDLVYKRVDDMDLKMDVYVPSDLPDNARLPAVVFIHGGPLRPDSTLLPKEWGAYKSYGALIAASGLVGVTFNHRFFTIEHLPKSASDLDDALQFVRKNSAALDVDPDRLCLWGFSNGGLLLATALQDNLSFLRCLVAFYARLELSSDTLTNFSEEDVKRFSSIAAIEDSLSASLPVFIARAGQDQLDGLNETIDIFVKKALAKNAPITLINHPNGRHAFDILDDDARTHEIIALAVKFIKTHLL